MQKMDGITATDKIRKDIPGGKDFIIIGVTANAFPEDEDKGIKAGMDSYLAKPVKRKELFIFSKICYPTEIKIIRIIHNTLRKSKKCI